MLMELTDTRKAWLIETAQALKGPDRRRFLARTVKELDLAANALLNALWAGIARPSARDCVNSTVASPAWMPLPSAAANAPRSICPPSSATSRHLSMGKVKLTLTFTPPACTRA